MKLKERDRPEKRCPNCNEPVQRRWVACPKCALSLNGRSDACPSGLRNVKRAGRLARVAAQSRPRTISGKKTKDNGRYVELQSLCHMAQQDEEQALLGIPHQLRAPYPEELTPYRPENLGMWREAAELGIPDGQYLFGKCLLGCGQADEGRQWLAEAATAGHLPAKRDLGEALLDLGRSPEGLKLLLEAAEGGDALACEVLAYRCQTGEGLQRSARKYHAFLGQAAALGIERAKLLLTDGRSE